MTPVNSATLSQTMQHYAFWCLFCSSLLQQRSGWKSADVTNC